MTYEYCAGAVLHDGFSLKIEYPLPNGNTKITTYFLAKCKSDSFSFDTSEILNIKLLPYDAALDAITYDNIKVVLKAANEFLNN